MFASLCAGIGHFTIYDFVSYFKSLNIFSYEDLHVKDNLPTKQIRSRTEPHCYVA